jgi:steroid delta-isomerase-like uncharacterized protein
MTWSSRPLRVLSLGFLVGTAVGLFVLRRTRRTRGGAAVVSANKEVIRRLVEGVWGDRNLGLIDELIAEDYIGHDPALPQPAKGRAGFRESVELYQAAFDSTDITIDDQFAEGDTVVTRWTGRGTHTGELMGIAPTGKDVTVSGITIARLRDGRIAEEWNLMDSLGMLVQLGAVPAPATA